MQSSRRRFLCDADEVLFDFQEPTLDIMQKVTGRRYVANDFEVWDVFSVLSPEELKGVFAELEKPGWCTSLEPKPGTIEAIEELRSICDVYVVTSPFHSKTWVHERYAALAKHFGFKKNEVVHTNAKHLVVGDMFLDDNPEHVDHWNAAHPGKVGMLWHIPNTRKLPYDRVRVRSWAEVVAKARAFKDQPTVYDLLLKAEWHTVSDREGVSYYCVNCGGVPWERVHKPGCQVDAILTSVYGTDRRIA